MDRGDYFEVEELSELQSLSREDLIQRILKLKREKKELSMKIESSTVTAGKASLSKTSDLTCRKPSEDHTPKDSNVETKKQNKQRPFDFTRYQKRHIALKMAYLGWNYHGFASQESTENTIEGHFFAALTKACLIENRADCNYSRCGRTDKGVSAFAQVVSLDVRSNLAEALGIMKSGDQEKVQDRIGMLMRINSCEYFTRFTISFKFQYSHQTIISVN